jgi:hypothetical protein
MESAMTDSVLTLVPNGGSAGWDEMGLGYDGTPIIWTVYNSSTSVMFSLQDAAVAGAITKITVAQRIAASHEGGRESTVYCQTKVDGTTYETAGIVRNVATPAWYYVDIAVNPKTGVAWLWPEIDDLQAGMRVTTLYGGWLNLYQYKIQVYYNPGTYSDTSSGGANVGISPGGMVM